MSSAIPLASRDGWSYGSGDFYVEASGHNRHRRATLPELKAHFDTNSDKPAHWYEAQLLHYGLPPSKTKGTAKMRLFEAVKKGDLSVPAHITKVEAALKKDWTKLERESKQALKKGAAETSAPARGTKRKADTTPAIQQLPGTQFNLSLSFSTGPLGTLQVVPTESSPAPKKARASKAATAPESKAKPKPAPKTTSAKAAAPKAAPKEKPAKPAPTKATKTTATKKTTPAEPPKSTPTKRTKTTAKKTNVDLTSSPPSQARTGGTASRGGRQTARRGGAFSGMSMAFNEPSASNMSMSSGGYLDPPPPYPGPGSSSQPINLGSDDNDSSLRPLGLLNGRYEVRVTGPPYAQDCKADSGIIMTLDGNALWGKFEIGPQTGIFRLPLRPYQSSHARLGMRVVSEDDDGEQYDCQDCWISFLGGGEIRGSLPYQEGEMTFEGTRISGQETRSEISAFDMREHWDWLTS
ncbi:hypothetical protein V8F20_005762 [Naviculisporaceae sp. PSN 640]